MIPPSEWHTYRRDDALSAHCPVAGEIVAPEVRWSLPVGGTLQTVVALPSGAMTGPPDLLLCYGGVISRVSVHGELRWRTAPLGVHAIAEVCDIDGDGAWEIVASNGYEILILAVDDGAVQWRRRFGPPEFYGVYASTLRVHRFFPERRGCQLIVPALHHRSIHLYDFSDGAAHGSLMHAMEMGDAFHPTVVVGDVNNDGVDEIVVTRLGSIAVFDPRLGAMVSSTIWNTDGERRRGYGQIALHDVDGDGTLELVILARQVTRHIAVLDNDGAGRFTPLWDRMIEHIYPSDHTELRYCLNAVFDLDGESCIAVSVFDEHNDGRWHAEIIDACTGGTIAEIADTVIVDVQPGRGGAPARLLTMHAIERPTNGLHTLRLMRYTDGSWRTAWNRADARFAMRTIGQTQTIGKFRPGLFEADAVWSDASGWYIFDADDRLVHVDLRTHAEKLLYAPAPERRSTTRVLAGVAGARLLVSDSDGTLAIVPGAAPPVILHCGISLATDGHPVERPSPTPVVFATRDGTRYIAVPDCGDTVSLFVCQGGDAPTLQWRVPGRGRIGFDRTHHSVTVADINNDGEPEIMFAVPGPHAILIACSVDGQEVCRYDFPDYPSVDAGARTGCYDWLVFSDNGRTYLYVAFYKSESMNSEESQVIDAATKEVRWSRSLVGEEIEGVGFGPWGLASRDGTTAYFCAKAFVCVVDLRTGSLVRPIVHLTALTRDALKAAGTFVDDGIRTLVTRDDPFTAYGSVLLRDVDGDGVAELVVAGSLGGFGVLQADGTPRWWHSAPLTDVAYRLGGICEVDGDGRLELGVGHADGAFVCQDAQTGREKWRTELGPTTIDCATCDIDGDGRDEFICRTTDGRLCAIGVDAAGTPVVKWTVLFDHAVGNPVIADVDGDGHAEILAVIGDGTMQCIGSAGPLRSS